ncbi:hypothetical protein WDU94_006712 [Cyamophila willieti]
MNIHTYTESDTASRQLFHIPNSRNTEMTSAEELLKEVLEVRIHQRNIAVHENQRLTGELDETRKFVDDLTREYEEVWTQNCLLEAILRRKNEKLEYLDTRVHQLNSQTETLHEEIAALKKINETLTNQVDVDKNNQANMLKQFLLNVRDLVEENHYLKDNLTILDKNLAEAKNDFKNMADGGGTRREQGGGGEEEEEEEGGGEKEEEEKEEEKEEEEEEKEKEKEEEEEENVISYQ